MQVHPIPREAERRGGAFSLEKPRWRGDSAGIKRVGGPRGSLTNAVPQSRSSSVIKGRKEAGRFSHHDLAPWRRQLLRTHKAEHISGGPLGRKAERYKRSPILRTARI